MFSQHIMIFLSLFISICFIIYDNKSNFLFNNKFAIGDIVTFIHNDKTLAGIILSVNTKIFIDQSKNKISNIYYINADNFEINYFNYISVDESKIIKTIKRKKMFRPSLIMPFIPIYIILTGINSYFILLPLLMIVFLKIKIYLFINKYKVNDRILYSHMKNNYGFIQNINLSFSSYLNINGEVKKKIENIILVNNDNGEQHLIKLKNILVKLK